MGEYAFILPSGQLDLTQPLGRNVANAADVLSVIRPQLRMNRALYRGQLDAMREGWLQCNEDLELTDGGDTSADAAMFQSILADAQENVRQWAKDMNLVFDGDRLREFIRQALINALVTKDGIEMLPDGALDY